MKVIFICDDEIQAGFVRDSALDLAEDIRTSPIGCAMLAPHHEVEVIAQLRPPSSEELVSMMEAMGETFTDAERLEWIQAREAARSQR